MDDEQSYDRGIVSTSLRSAGFELDAQLNQLLSTVTFPANLPILPAKDIVAFPSVTLSLHITRDSSVRAVEKALMDNKYIFVVGQKEGAIDQSDAKSFYQIGVVASVVRFFPMSADRHKVILQGIARAQISNIGRVGDILVGEVELIRDRQTVGLSKKAKEDLSGVRTIISEMVQNEYLPEELLLLADEVNHPGVLSDILLAHFRLDVAHAQKLLEELDSEKRLSQTRKILIEELQRMQVGFSIQEKAYHELARGQQEYFLKEQLKVIQKELGESANGTDDLDDLRQALTSAKLPKIAATEAQKQLARLERLSTESSEHSLLRTYLEWMADLPWSIRTRDRLNLKVAERVLNQDHFGLDKPKQRILEYLSVRKLNKDSKGPILCFVGPPGVGKTSLGQSIARAMNRKFLRLSLGGVRDEAEIRGHRRTYVGALPGRILQGLKQVSSRNPVFVLDELDKLGADFRGDPSSALLEVLDPQQNRFFSDHYLNLDFDLSEVLFVATANTIDTIPDALLDRLEVIYISGYTREEKLSIAKSYLVPRQLKENGIDKINVSLSEAAILLVIDRYTRESGVRNLEREIGTLCRKLARQYAEKRKVEAVITPQLVQRMLGVPAFDPEYRESQDLIGLAHGLAWTIHGGELMSVEVSVAQGSGKLNLTGQLGDVMQESAQAALFYARANSEILGLAPDFYEKFDIHIHVPSGATPKDGPSAGITICAALISALARVRISHDISMTGEITLRGNVFAVGGIKEKVLAAVRHGVKRIIIPADNVKDLEDVPKEQRQRVTFIPVRHISEVLKEVFVDRLPVARVQRRSVTKNAPKSVVRARL